MIVVTILAAVGATIIFPFFVSGTVGMLADLAVLFVPAFRQAGMELSKRINAWDRVWLARVAIPYLVLLPFGIVDCLLTDDWLGLGLRVAWGFICWWVWKNRPRKKKKPSRVAAVVREVAGRLVIVPTPAHAGVRRDALTRAASYAWRERGIVTFF